jgi:hypothetical protein
MPSSSTKSWRSIKLRHSRRTASDSPGINLHAAHLVELCTITHCLKLIEAVFRFGNELQKPRLRQTLSERAIVDRFLEARRVVNNFETHDQGVY